MKTVMTLLAVFLLVWTTVRAATLHVGPMQPYADPRAACKWASPGDTVLMHPAEYRGTYFLENINGTAALPIVIRGTDRATVVFNGGEESLHLSDCSYLVLENFSVKGQTGNGMNCDDAGTYDTPAHHIVFRAISFGAMAATGNNDQLKLSGLDDFIVESCVFEDGSAGGSGADMVGCHRGIFRNNTFCRLGSNCIQAKGGTQFIRIERNVFSDGGQRALNLGGSTGLPFFRPLDAPFEAADIIVISNLFVRSVTPIAYVGSVRVSVTNNTIIDPERWVFRILQETVDTARFLPCGQNVFRNNCVVFRSSLSRQVNIGPNTAPTTFLLQNNLWFNVDDPGASQPQEPQLRESNAIYGRDPMLRGYATGDYRPRATSPLIGAGASVADTSRDLDGNAFAIIRSIGAYEGASVSSVADDMSSQDIAPLLVRTAEGYRVDVPLHLLPLRATVSDVRGARCREIVIDGHDFFVPASPYEFVQVHP
ncbi:MAG: hypothetical protein ACKO9V_04520 [Candidatus Kapaibacterium sp.]